MPKKKSSFRRQAIVIGESNHGWFLATRDSTSPARAAAQVQKEFDQAQVAVHIVWTGTSSELGKKLEPTPTRTIKPRFPTRR